MKQHSNNSRQTNTSLQELRAPYAQEHELVSVIIPSYGHPTLLKRCVESVRAQTYRNIEIIVVDDNDPKSQYRKDTERIIMQMNGENIKYLKHTKNQGGSAARNTGLRQAKGRYIAFLDNDDYWSSKKIEKQVSLLKKLNKSWGGVYCGARLVGRQIENISTSRKGNLQLDILLKTAKLQGGSTILLRTEAVKKTGFFDESYRRHQDIEYLLRFFRNYKMHAVDENLVTISTSTSSNKLNSNELIKVKMRLLNDFRKDIKSYPLKYQRQIYYLHYYEICIWCLKDKNIKAFKDYYKLCLKYQRPSTVDRFNLALYFVDSCLNTNIRKLIRFPVQKYRERNGYW